MSLASFDAPGQKSRVDAARWVVHRRTEGASREQIVRELVQDGMRLICLAVAVDVAALAWPSRLVEADGPGTGLTKTGIVIAAVVSTRCLNRWKPWYELVVGDDGNLRWYRL